MLDSKKVKQIAKSLGADLVGIASMDRFEGAPPQMDPRFIMPRAKSMVVFAFRIYRGSLRGIEEGTHMSNYPSMGYGGINNIYMPIFVMNFSRIFEDEGYECIPFGYHDYWRPIDAYHGPESYRGGKPLSRPVAPGKPAPDVMPHMRIAAYLAGLGEIGYSNVFLTPEFGPRQRLGMVMTEMELEPDPIYEGPPLCNRCMACVRDCPGDAISATETVKVNLAGHTVEMGKLDSDACAMAFRGAEKCKPGEWGTYIEGSNEYKPSPITPYYKKPHNIYMHGEAICGGRGCLRACMINLEAQGAIRNQFKYPFRTQKPWTVDWSDYDPTDDRVRA